MHAGPSVQKPEKVSGQLSLSFALLMSIMVKLLCFSQIYFCMLLGHSIAYFSWERDSRKILWCC